MTRPSKLWSRGWLQRQHIWNCYHLATIYGFFQQIPLFYPDCHSTPWKQKYTVYKFPVVIFRFFVQLEFRHPSSIEPWISYRYIFRQSSHFGLSFITWNPISCHWDLEPPHHRPSIRHQFLSGQRVEIGSEVCLKAHEPPKTEKKNGLRIIGTT